MRIKVVKSFVGILVGAMFVLCFASIAPAPEPPPDTGCTLTPGYWKTHSSYGPAPYDDTWAEATFTEDTMFYLSGKSYYDVLWTSPERGNAYYILAHQFIAAALNYYKGAWVPGDVVTALSTARDLFEIYTPADIGAMKGNNEIRVRFIRLAGVLDAYNNGIIGPGHCTK
jgi:hypothetical protein